MTKAITSLISWLLIIGVGIAWIINGFSSWYLLLVPLAYVTGSLGEGKFTALRTISLKQILIILTAFIVSVAVVFGLLQLANYVINDVLRLTGGVKTFSQIAAIILLLYPVKILFGTVVYKVWSKLEVQRR